MKLVMLSMAACGLALAGCASPVKTNADGTAVAKEERCLVTGSNVPKRDCRNDVVVLPPSAVETVMPVLPGPGTGRQ